MRQKHRLFMMGGLLAGAVALGCQAPPSTTPTTPRTIVRVGAIQLDQATDLAIEYKKNCDDVKPSYNLKQAIDPRIVKFKLKITGTTIVDTIEDEVTVASFLGGCVRTKEIADLPPGTYTVLMNGVDVNDTPISWDTNTMTLVAGGPTLVIPVTCDFTTGKVSVEINCCSPSPSAPPSSSPAPSPVPTATPTPTPMLTPSPINPYGTTGTATGFAVDADGDIFIFARKLASDPTGICAPSPPRPSMPTNMMIKVESDLSSFNPAFKTDLYGNVLEGEIRDRQLYFVEDGNGGCVAHNTPFYRVDLDSSATISKPLSKGWSSYNYIANTIDDKGTANLADDVIIFASGGALHTNEDGYIIWREDEVLDYNSKWLLNISTAATEMSRPISMSWDDLNQRVVFSSAYGICATSPSERNVAGTLLPSTVLVPMPGSQYTYGLELVDVQPDVTTMLFTKYVGGDLGVYFATAPTGGSPSIVTSWTSENGVPYRVEKGRDGKYYVMLLEEAPSGLTSMQAGHERYRIIRFSLNGTQLVPELTMVDTFVNRDPSYH